VIILSLEKKVLKVFDSISKMKSKIESLEITVKETKSITTKTEILNRIEEFKAVIDSELEELKGLKWELKSR
jgi:regulator of replication initiation timing